MKRKFDFWDYFIFSVVLIISVSIGIFFGLKLDEKLDRFFKTCFRKKNRESKVDVELEEKIEQSEVCTDEGSQKNVKTLNYLTAKNSMGAIPLALSLLSTFFTSSSLLGFPAEVYQYGIEYWISIIGICVIPVIGAFVTGPFFSNLKIVSIFEYLKMRYESESVRMLGVTLYLIRTLISMGIVIYGPATALNSLTNFTTETSIIMIGVIATFYTTIGGLKAVIWTDAFQAIMMFSGLMAVIIKGTYDVGGLSNLWQSSYEGGRINFFNFDPNPFVRQSFWSLVFGSVISWAMPYAIDQQMMQRFSAGKSKRTAQIALLLNIPGVVLLISVCCFSGLVLYANYKTCDPLSDSLNSGIKNPNQLVAYFVMEKFNNIPLVPGIFLASIFCASLSSVSSGLNSMSACIWTDYLMRFKYFRNFSDNKSSVTTKIVVLISGCVCTGFGFLISTIGSNLLQISATINGSLDAPLIGMFLISSMIPFINIYGLFAGSISGFLTVVWLGLGSFIVEPDYPKLPVSTETCMNQTYFSSTISPIFKDPSKSQGATNLSGFNVVYSVSYMWLSPIGVFVVLCVGIIVSLLTRKYTKDKILNDRLIIYRSLRNK